MNATGFVRWPDATRRCFPLVAVGCLGLVVSLTAAARAPGPRSVVTNDKAALQGVSADSAGDGWAVGINPAGQHAVLHWNGTSWTPVALPVTERSTTSAVSALSPTDAWIVGAGTTKQYGGTLALHWNGSRWARVPTPTPLTQGIDLLSVSARSATDVWAVGIAPAPGIPGGRPAGLHWNGTRWIQVSMPRPAGSTGSEFMGVSADSRSDAWAVGRSFKSGGAITSLIGHWNGSRWRLVRSPDPGGNLTDLYSVSALSGNDAWAVGTYFASTGQKTLVLRWNGSSWTQVSSPSPGQSSALTGVTALSPSNAWAVGSDTSGTLVLHWNGSKWAQVANPNPGGGSGSLSGVSAVSRSDAWAVGCICTGDKTGGEHTIILHWNGRSWVRS